MSNQSDSSDKSRPEGFANPDSFLPGETPPFDFIVESINDSILVCDLRGAITYVNRRFAKLIAYDRQQLVDGMTIFDVVTPKGAQQLKELLSKRQEGGEESDSDWQYELELKRQDGSVATGLINTTPIKGEDGAYTGTIAAITDITERKEAEEALRAARAELEERVKQRTAELEKANEAMQREVETRRLAETKALEASKAKSAFLANMSHELRTPLNAVLGYTELIDEDINLFLSGDDPELPAESIQNDLHKIHRAATHLLAIINDILDLSKVEAGRMDLHHDTFEFGDLLDEIAETISPLVTTNNNELNVEIDDSLGTVTTDRTKLKQVLLNLASNASKFTSDGTVTIKAKLDESGPRGCAVVEVSDTGVGIAQDKLEDLFAPFTQADSSTTREYGGTGLGLTICKRFCELMGGEISAESEKGVGSTFSVRIPVDSKQVSQDPAPSEVEWSEEHGVPHVGDAEDTLVLVIDDDADVHELMRRFLVSRGYQVISAYGGDQGLEYARKLQPDIITLDVMMPGRDGWSVLTEIKSDDELAEIPIVIVSMINDRNIGYALGASEYLVKPIQRDRLVGTLSRFRSKSAEGSVLVVEDEADTREMVRRHLDRAGWQVETAENGRVALERLEEGLVPDVVVLDLMMPEVDGFEVAATMRQKPDWADIPIVVLTAMDLSDADHAQLRDSVSRILQKGSTSIDSVVDHILEALDSKAAAPVA
ncbi:response regulator [Persicimonas caeni]|uniref:histidine kinase n=1 Tax=Persicimonas caeni TaxID=2292766 RepID=A0A4Y6PS13_PERCE|nr:response regulator [Persicimonas caeni]QDG51013.1 response regulator [Persicimonas caeni]QED32234.1 response regulator [Persicimonas caeni]